MAFTLLALLLTMFSLDLAKKCGRYVVGSVWIHKGGAVDEGTGNFEGCEKGCFFNGSYDASGVRTCELCTAIKDQTLCTDNGGTCRWVKDKCKSQSCPEMAKNLNAFVGDTPTAAAGRTRRYQECVNGTPKEQYFNNIYIKDYEEHTNTGNVNASLNWNRNLCDDRQPAQPGGTPPIQCRFLPGTNRTQCEFNATKRWNNINDGYQQTPYEVCMIGPMKNSTTGEQARYDNLSNKTDYQTLTGYSLPSQYCQHLVNVALETCARNYKTAVDACYTANGLPSSAQELDHVHTKAARTACHRIYHCMYSQSNGRCSVWAIWAFVFFIVVMVLVVAGGAVAGIAVFKDKLREYTKL